MDEADNRALAAYRAGDAGALEPLVRKHRGPLFGYIRNMSGSVQEAEEIFQETWLRFIRNPDAFRGGNFPGWLMRIAHNLFIDRIRRRKPDESLDDDKPGDSRQLRDRVADPRPGPVQELAATDLGQRIAAAVATLPAEQREVFLMRVEADLSFREIAGIQKVSINTALARMQYALAKLRPLLQDEDQMPLAAGMGMAR